MKQQEQKTINLSLPVPVVEIILGALNELPRRVSDQAFQMVAAQAQSQLVKPQESGAVRTVEPPFKG